MEKAGKPEYSASDRADRAKFIVLEGIDGAGKGVQSRILHKAMEDAGKSAILSREPGGSPGAEEIRKLVVSGAEDRWDDITELLLICAARRSHLVDTVWPALKRGAWVISDRFADSSRAFQGIAGQLGLDVVDALHQQVAGNFQPDLTLVLDLDAEIALRRAGERGGDNRFESKGLPYQQRVREGYLLLVRQAPEHRVLIDASQPVGKVSQAIFEAVNERLGLRLEPPK